MKHQSISRSFSLLLFLLHFLHFFFWLSWFRPSEFSAFKLRHLRAKCSGEENQCANSKQSNNNFFRTIELTHTHKSVGREGIALPSSCGCETPVFDLCTQSCWQLWLTASSDASGSRWSPRISHLRCSFSPFPPFTFFFFNVVFGTAHTRPQAKSTR